MASLEGMAERTVSISSAGKTFSFTGWKVGWVTAPTELRNAIMTAKQFLTFVSAGPLQPAIAAGLRLDDDYFSGLRDGLANKRDILRTGLEAAGFTVHPCQGTYFLTADITEVAERNDMPATSVEFALALPARAGVVAVPSEVFYKTPDAGKSLIRFAFCKKDELLNEATSRLSVFA